MSIQAAVARIDQILTWQQQIATGQLPGATTSSTGSVAGSDPSQPVTAGTSSSFSDALAAAQGTASGVLGGATSGGASVSGAPQAVQEMTTMANSLIGKPYVYGGGHSGWGP
jgi:cell wall-associated NlpC family hydrolase